MLSQVSLKLYWTAIHCVDGTILLNMLLGARLGSPLVTVCGRQGLLTKYPTTLVKDGKAPS